VAFTVIASHRVLCSLRFKVHAAIQQTGFRRVKRNGLSPEVKREQELRRAKRDLDGSPWAMLRAAMDAEDEAAAAAAANPSVVHDETYFSRLQHTARSKQGHRWVLGVGQ